MNTVHVIKCGNCGGRHAHVDEVKACYGLARSTQAAAAAVASKALPVANADMITPRQLQYIADLGGDPETAKHYTKAWASRIIDDLKKGRNTVTQSQQPTAPKPHEEGGRLRTTKIPLDMLKSIRDGYYASRMDSDHSFTFFRVSRPLKGQYKGAIKIQTQHGPDLKMALAIYPGDRLYWSNKNVEDDLLLVVVDQRGCAIAYAEEIGRCMRCSTELTDDRSRWYGIGPECEKRWPEIIGEIEDTKGPFRYGS